MGAGCYYTHKETNTKAYWVEFGYFDQDLYDSVVEDILGELKKIFEKLGYQQIDDRFGKPSLVFENNLFSIQLESTYHGDAFVIRLEPQSNEHPLYQLALGRHAAEYKRIMRQVNQLYPLHIATSSWTSTEIKTNQLK